MKFTFTLARIISFDEKDQKKKIAFIIWMLVTIFCVVQSLITQRFNNYLIFENTFRNLIHSQSFFASYPDRHFDTNHYGPIFSVFFAPFALLPNGVGFMIWNLFNSILLFKAIELIPVKNKTAIYFIAIPCLVAASLSQQFNPVAGAFIILSYTQLNKNKGFWSAFFIILGTFIKLYGIVGLAFFFFVKDKKRFIAYLIFWAVLLFVLPMLFSSPQFIIQSYKDWAASLIQKNASNIAGNATDISIMGFIRSIFISHNIPNSVFLLIGMAIFGLPFLNFKAYKNEKFQLYVLASVLLFPVLFSTGSEDCTYIIAITGVGIWYVFAESGWFKTWLFAIVMVFSCNFPLLLFPNLTDEYPITLSMLSFPFFMAWVLIIYKASTLKKEENFVLVNDQTNYAT